MKQIQGSITQKRARAGILVARGASNRVSNGRTYHDQALRAETTGFMTYDEQDEKDDRRSASAADT